MDERRRKLQKTVLRVTRWVGSPQSIFIHTALFAVSFGTVYAGVFTFDRMLLVLTTVVSLEAIYLSLFIQMTVNYTTESLEEVEEDIGAIQEDIDEIQEDVEEMSEEDKADEAREAAEGRTLEEIHAGLQKLMQDVERLQNHAQSVK